MRRASCPAIVLRCWPYSETSLTTRLLTPDLGTVSALAKGVQRVTSGSFGVIDPWCLVHADLDGPDDADLLNLRRARLLDRFPGLGARTDRLAAAGVVGELAELAAPPGVPAPRAFLYLERSLRTLDGEDRVAARLCALTLQGLDLLGLEPRLEEEGDDEDPARRRWFSPAAGGLVLRAAERPHDRARPVTPALLERLRGLRDGSQDPAALTPDEVEACTTILGEFLHYHLERAPKAWAHLPHPRPQRSEAT